jgi:hypothetical protein
MMLTPLSRPAEAPILQVRLLVARPTLSRKRSQ